MMRRKVIEQIFRPSCQSQNFADRKMNFFFFEKKNLQKTKKQNTDFSSTSYVLFLSNNLKGSKVENDKDG